MILHCNVSQCVASYNCISGAEVHKINVISFPPGVALSGSLLERIELGLEMGILHISAILV